ncbi:helix-turn-helix domain-containing protein [Rhizobium sp. 0TCS1.26]|uniref:helix-turn-helix domain-containing protein n=1 Tax=Rhizobium sp. 0TCS1.26 TaxID=3142623 RepID=UPI003D2A1E8B
MSHKATMWAVTVRGISCAEARVLWHLSDCHNPVEGCFPSQEYLAEACEIDERSVRRHLLSLKAKGLVNWAEQREGKYRKNNRYSLGFEAGFIAAPPEVEADNLSGSNIGSSTGQNEQFEPDKIDVLNRTLESAKPVIEPVREPEREGASATFDGSRKDREKVEKAFRRWWPSWATYPNGSEDAARRAWFELSPEQRQACIDRTPAFIAAVRERKGGSFTYPAVYLKERAWERLEDPRSDVAPPSMHNAFSRAWMALRLNELLKPMATAWPVMTAFQRMKAGQDAEAAKAVEMERREKYGWPKVNSLHDMASNGKGATVLPTLMVISESFEKVHRDSELAARWKALHARRGWPWLPQTGHEWLYFPSGEPEDAMAEFEARLNEGKGHDDAA